MCTKVEAEAIIQSTLDVDRLKRIIRNTSNVAWKGVVSEKEVDKWLSNFTGKYFSSIEIERKLALWLLAHFTYYSYDDIRVLCKTLFNRILHEKLVENKGYKSFDDVLSELMNESLFVGLGNNSESGQSILYFFRQENKLSKKSFDVLQGKHYKNIIFIDDVTMSGSQAITYMNTRKIDVDNTYAGFLIATDSAIKTLLNSGKGVKPIAAMILDDRDRAFSDCSYVFSDKKVCVIRSYAEEFCRVYGEMVVKDDAYMKKYPLGFKDGQYMLGFEYNTPDNSLPIFWGQSNNWIPIFKRYEKIYGSALESVNDGRLYY